MAKKAPRRTAERILEVAQELFNRFGEPNVSTAMIAADLGISPGNLHYHYPAKDALVNALFERHAQDLGQHLEGAGSVGGLEQAECFLRGLFGHIWAMRFLYRDLNDLLSRNRHLELSLQPLLEQEALALRLLLDSLRRHDELDMSHEDIGLVADSMMVVLTFWLSHEYLRAPRQALEPESGGLAQARGLRQVLHLMSPYLRSPSRLPAAGEPAGVVTP